jgi:hypothetical protein
MKLFIGAPVVPDNGYDPASGITLRPAGKKIERLVNTAAGTPAVTPQVTRQLTLNEFMGLGGPLEVLVNNTKWGGRSVATDVFVDGIRPDFTYVVNGNYVSEAPQEGQTELWEIVNMTADAHPIHLHLVQFQLINRQNYNVNRYTKAYDGLFPVTSAIDPMTGQPYPGGVFIGGFGPPLDYNTGNARALGGNPDITPYLQGAVQPPESYEQGWKDTMIMYPGEVTRIMVRWTPSDSTATGKAFFPFLTHDDSGTANYVWHCHIIDHEDNEMMRPDIVLPNPDPAVTRTYLKGTDY